MKNENILTNASCYVCDRPAVRLTPKVKGDNRRFAVCENHGLLSVENKLRENGEKVI